MLDCAWACGMTRLARSSRPTLNRIKRSDGPNDQTDDPNGQADPVDQTERRIVFESLLKVLSTPSQTGRRPKGFRVSGPATSGVDDLRAGQLEAAGAIGIANQATCGSTIVLARAGTGAENTWDSPKINDAVN
jgi:hypothetical protein